METTNGSFVPASPDLIWMVFIQQVLVLIAWLIGVAVRRVLKNRMTMSTASATLTGLAGLWGGLVFAGWIFDSGDLWKPGMIAVAALVALVVVIVLTRSGQGTGGDVPEDTNSAAPTESAWDETSTPTPTPSSHQSSQRCPVTTVSTQTNQPSKGIAGGGLQAPDISGWDNSPSFYLDWVSDLHTLIDDVYPGWMSNVSVGALNATDGFTDPTVSAHQTMECYASSGYYSGYTGRKDLVDEATTVNGHQAWHMQAEVYVTMSNLPQVEGDVVDVYVVDVGSDDHFGVFISSVTIGDSARDKKVRDCIAGLKVVS